MSTTSTTTRQLAAQNVVVADAPVTEQISDLATLFARAKPEAEREAFRASFAVSDAVAEPPTVEKLVATIATPAVAAPPDDAVPIRDTEGAYNLLVSLIQSVFASDATKQTSLLSSVISAIPQAEHAGASLKTQILTNIFNLLPATSGLRLQAYHALVDLVASQGDLDIVTPTLEQLPVWLAQWEVSSEEKESLLAHVAEVLRNGSDNPKQAYEFTLVYLRYLSASGALTNDKASAEAALTSAIALPDVFDFETLANIPAATKALEGSPAGSLLQALISGPTAEVSKWLSANASEASKLDTTALKRKSTLLDLADACAKVAGESSPSAPASLSYTQIGEILSAAGETATGPDAVEGWLIDLIRAGLAAGKLSQTRQTFRVFRASHRAFGSDQWKLLQTRLEEWDDAISRILGTLSSATAEKRPELPAPVAETQETPATAA